MLLEMRLLQSLRTPLPSPPSVICHLGAQQTPLKGHLDNGQVQVQAWLSNLSSAILSLSFDFFSPIGLVRGRCEVDTSNSKGTIQAIVTMTVGIHSEPLSREGSQLHC